MNKLKNRLFCAFLCLTSMHAHRTFGAHPADTLRLKDDFRVKEFPKESPRSTGILQRLKSRWNAFTVFKKPKPPVTKSTPAQVSDPSMQESVSLNDSLKTLTKDDEQAIERIAHQSERLRTHRNNPAAPVSIEAKQEIDDLITQSTLVLNARSVSNPTSPELDEAFYNFEKAHENYVEAILSGRPTKTEKTALNETIQMFIAVLKKTRTVPPLALPSDADAGVVKALQAGHFATINDVDEETKVLFRLWDIDIKQVNETLLVAKSQPDNPYLYLKLVKVQANLEASTSKLIAGIGKSDYSEVAQAHWDTVKAFPELLRKSQQEAETLKKEWETLRKNPATEQLTAIFDKLYAKITDLKGQRLKLKEIQQLSLPHYPDSLAGLISRMQRLTSLARGKTKKSFFSRLFT